MSWDEGVLASLRTEEHQRHQRQNPVNSDNPALAFIECLETMRDLGMLSRRDSEFLAGLRSYYDSRGLSDKQFGALRKMTVRLVIGAIGERLDCPY